MKKLNQRESENDEEGKHGKNRQSGENLEKPKLKNR